MSCIVVCDLTMWQKDMDPKRGLYTDFKSSDMPVRNDGEIPPASYTYEKSREEMTTDNSTPKKGVK